MSKSRIVIGDVHGCYLTLVALVEKLPKGVPITISGDLIDRGPRSRQVVQWCIDNQIDVTLGNHEEMMVTNHPAWLGNGGYKALESYGCQVVQTGYGSSSIYFPEAEMSDQFDEHIEYMKSLPLFIEYPEVTDSNGRKLVVSHSSIASVWDFSEKRRQEYADQFKQNIIWGRPSTIRDIPDIYNIFGHTVVSNGPKIKVPFANLDTGCCFKPEPGVGILTAMMFPEMTIFQQENIDV